MDQVPPFTKWAQSYVSIATHKQGINVYINRAWGLAFHISPEHDFWKYFQVIGVGKKKGDIVGGPEDGGSHTPMNAKAMLALQSQGKDYNWFTRQKNRIL